MLDNIGSKFSSCVVWVKLCNSLWNENTGHVGVGSRFAVT